MPTDTEGHGDGESAPSGNSNTYDVIVVGAGAAGVGVSIALIHAGVENFLIVDRDTVGASLIHGQPRLDSSPLRSQATPLECSI